MSGSVVTNRPHEKLEVWKEAMDLVVEVYAIIKRFPKHEQFALSSQLQRSCISIPSNIAEGAGRRSDKDFLRFLDMARGSITELETQILIAYRLNYINDTDRILRLSNKVFSKLSALMNTIRSRLNTA